MLNNFTPVRWTEPERGIIEHVHGNRRAVVHCTADKRWIATINYTASKRGTQPIRHQGLHTRRQAMAWACAQLGIDKPACFIDSPAYLSHPPTAAGRARRAAP